MWNIIFLITGLIFDIFLLVIFFSKEVIDSKENKYFKLLIIANLAGYMSEIPLQMMVRFYGIDFPVVNIFVRLYLLLIFSWFSLFSIYTLVVCLNQEDENKNFETNMLQNNISK